jgi:GNAT superfamily N-acetyltransferase
VNIPGHSVRRVTAADAPAMQSLFATDLDYWSHAEGAPLRPDEALLSFDDRPPSVPLERKHVFVVDDVALLDMLEGYPDERTWFLGLIFIVPHARNRGLGTRLVEAVCDHARGHGASALRLAVAQNHPDARRLYERLGFRFVDNRERTIYTGAIVDLAVLERPLHPP